VRNAVGYDSTRGDKLSVVNTAFDGMTPPGAETLEQPDLWTRIGQAQKPLATALALVALLVVAGVTMRALKPAKAAEPATAESMAALPAGTHTTEHPVLAAVEGGSTPIALPEGDGHQQILIAGPATSSEPMVLREIANPVRDQVVAIIDQRPEAATRIVRAWLKQD